MPLDDLDLPSQLVCIWYPSGGFGHFVNAVLCMHSPRFENPQQHHEFSANGDSHHYPLLLPKYRKHTQYQHDQVLRAGKIYTVLIDNGIDDESTDYRVWFPGAPSIKLCYDDHTWPIVARTWIEKAQKIDLDQAVDIDQDRWPERTVWARREKYFLYLRDHELRQRWRPDPDCHNISVQSLLQYDTMCASLTEFGVTDSFQQLWNAWFAANAKYICPVLFAQQLLDHPECSQDLQHLTLWEQAVVNYFVWLRHGIEIPANDYSDWFHHSDQLHQVITQLSKHTSA